MKTEVKKVSDCKRKLHITISKDDVKKDYQNILRKFRNQVSLSGFRKGKAPLQMIENSYKENIKASYLDEFLPKYYQQALEKLREQKIFPINQGELDDFKWEPENELKVSFKFEVNPTIKLEEYKNFTINFKPEKYLEKMLEKELKNLQYHNAKISDKKTAAEYDDLIYYKIEKYGEEKINKDKENSYKIGQKIFGEKFDKAVLGVKKDDIINTSINIASQQDSEKIKEKNVTLKIISVKNVDLPKFDDEFAKEVGDYKTFGELKNDIKKNIENVLKEKNQNKKESLILEKIIEKNPFEVPEFLVNNYLEKMIKKPQNNQQSTSDEMEKIYTNFAENELKKYYIFTKLNELEKVEITNEDIENEIENNAKIMNMDVENYKKLYEKQIDKDSIKVKLKNEKILQNIEKTIKFVEKK